MDFAELFFGWIVPIGVYSGVLALAGIRWGAVACALALLVYDNAATDNLLLDTAWSTERLFDDPSSALILTFAIVAVAEIILEAALPVMSRLLSWVRPAATMAMGVAVFGTGPVTMVAGGAAGFVAGVMGAYAMRGLLDGARRGGGHPVLLSLMMTVAVLVALAATIAVPLVGFIVLALLARITLRLRSRSEERHEGLRILA